jgi:thiol-disulfide isomerase/thioredoxin
MRGIATIAIIAGVIIAGLASVLISGRQVGTPTPSALIEAAYPLVTGQVQNFILYDTPQAAPEIAFQDGGNKDLDLTDFRGQYVLLNFWATWCGPCKREMPSLDRLQAQMGGKNFYVLALSEDRTGLDDVKEFFTDFELVDLDIYIDDTGASSRIFAVGGLPATVLLDPAGNIVARMIGPAEWDAPETIAFLEHFSAATADGRSADLVSGPNE